MIENIIKDMVESNTTGRLTDASKRCVARMKEKNEIKKLLWIIAGFLQDTRLMQIR